MSDLYSAYFLGNVFPAGSVNVDDLSEGQNTASDHEAHEESLNKHRCLQRQRDPDWGANNVKGHEDSNRAVDLAS